MNPKENQNSIFHDVVKGAWLREALLIGDVCQSIFVDLKNDANSKQSYKKGKYKLSNEINGKPSWVSNEKELAIWWSSQYSQWAIGSLDDLGTNIRGLTGFSTK